MSENTYRGILDDYEITGNVAVGTLYSSPSGETPNGTIVTTSKVLTTTINQDEVGTVCIRLVTTTGWYLLGERKVNDIE